MLRRLAGYYTQKGLTRAWAPPLAAFQAQIPLFGENFVEDFVRPTRLTECPVRFLRVCCTPLLKNQSSSSSAQNGANGVTEALKADLRKLYMRVHPDLFHHSPEHRETNEKSFARLQEYLQLASGGEGHIQGPVRIDFYVRQQAGDSGSKKDERVFAVLPPPQAHWDPAGGLSPSTVSALVSLLEKCGVEARLDPLNPGSSIGGDTGLLAFLPHAAHAIRKGPKQAGSSGRNDSLDAGLARQALRVGRGVVVQIVGAEVSDPADVVLTQLVRAVDMIPNLNLRGCTVQVCGSRGISPRGHVLLHHRDSTASWAQTLQEVDWDEVAATRREAAAVDAREQALASVLRVPMILTAEESTFTEKYTDFLQRTMDTLKGRDPPGVEGTTPLFVCADEEGLPGTPAFSLCLNRRLLLVPVTATPDQVYNCVADFARMGAAMLRQREEDEAMLNSVTKSTMKTLRVRRLECGEGVSSMEFISCCNKLSANKAALIDHVEGLSLRISKFSGISECKVYIDVFWDFKLR